MSHLAETCFHLAGSDGKVHAPEPVMFKLEKTVRRQERLIRQYPLAGQTYPGTVGGWLRNDPPRQPLAGAGGLPSLVHEQLRDIGPPKHHRRENDER